MLMGHVGRIEADFVGGWAADSDAPDSVIDVVIYVDGKRAAQVSCNKFRSDLRDLKIYGQGCHGFQYTFPVPLPSHLLDRIAVRFARSGRILPEGEKVFPEGRGLGAIMITAPGRSGTTFAMDCLSRSPQVCIAETPPFEVRLISYWATVVRILTDAADFDRSMHPDHLEGDGFRVGSNPFAHNSFLAAFQSKELATEYFSVYAPTAIRDVARKLIVEYYLRLRDEQAKQEAVFLAEKCNSLHRPTRRFARLLFPDLKEIVLVRDPRDLLCSQLSYFHRTPEEIVPKITEAAQELMKIARDDADHVIVARYEDLIGATDKTLESLATRLGIELPAAIKKYPSDVFKVHATSVSPEASIGRWRTDLSPEMQATCALSWRAFISEFGYES